MSEKEITNAIMQYLKKQPHCFCWKEHGGMYGTAGIPDIICCYNGRFVTFEVKAPGGRLTKLQDFVLKRIGQAGGVAVKVSSLDEVKEIIRKMEVASDGD